MLVHIMRRTQICSDHKSIKSSVEMGGPARPWVCKCSDVSNNGSLRPKLPSSSSVLGLSPMYSSGWVYCRVWSGFVSFRYTHKKIERKLIQYIDIVDTTESDGNPSKLLCGAIDRCFDSSKNKSPVAQNSASLSRQN